MGEKMIVIIVLFLYVNNAQTTPSGKVTKVEKTVLHEGRSYYYAPYVGGCKSNEYEVQ